MVCQAHFMHKKYATNLEKFETIVILFKETFKNFIQRFGYLYTTNGRYDLYYLLPIGLLHL